MEILNGTLDLGGGGTNVGAIAVSAGATLSLSGGTFASSGGSDITGDGQLLVGGASVATFAGLVNLAGTNLFSGGTAEFTGNYICTNNTLAIAGGTANFDGTGTVAPAVLNLGNSSGMFGTLGGAQTVTVGHVMNWAEGEMTGGGRTVIPPGATLNVPGADTVFLSSRTLENGGTVLWTGTANISAADTVITNRAGALFAAQNAASFYLVSGALSRFDNAGTFQKSGSGTTGFGNSMVLNNYAAVAIQSGTLDLGSGGANSGTITVPAGAALSLSGGTFTSTGGSSITGAGQFTVSGATATFAGFVNLGGTNVFSGGTAEFTGNYICTNNTLVVAGGTVNFDGTGTVAPAVLNLGSSSGIFGTLGGAQTVIVGNVMNWVEGEMTGGGRTVILPGATLNVPRADTVYLSSRTLENGGTVLWTGTANIFAADTVITNRAGALFAAQNAATFYLVSGALSRFDNAGTFQKSGSGTTGFGNSMVLNNYAAVAIQSGTLDLGSGGANSGTITVPAGAALSLSGGTFTSTGGSSITGAGQFTVSGATATLAGLVNVTGTNSFGGGTANLTGNYFCTNNTLVISGGTANFNGTGTVAPTTLNLTGYTGVLGGTGLVTVGSLMNWTEGTMSGGGRTVISSGATLNVPGADTVYLSSRTLENGGTVVWSGPATIYAVDTVITNRPGALFDARNAATLYFNFGNPTRFDNAGTFRKSGGGTTAIGAGIAFSNYNTVDIQVGELAANGGFASSSNAVLNCALSGTIPGTNYGQLQVSGSVTLNGILSVNLANNYIPTTNDSFTVVSAGTCNGAFANFIYPSNKVSMLLSNTPTSVIVRASAVLVVPQPMVLQPALSGSNVVLTWSTVSNTTYRVEFNPDLTLSNWNALPGDVTGASNTASKSDTLTPSNRFYRVLILP